MSSAFGNYQHVSFCQKSSRLAHSCSDSLPYLWTSAFRPRYCHKLTVKTATPPLQRWRAMFSCCITGKVVSLPYFWCVSVVIRHSCTYGSLRYKRDGVVLTTSNKERTILRFSSESHNLILCIPLERRKSCTVFCHASCRRSRSVPHKLINYLFGTYRTIYSFAALLPAASPNKRHSFMTWPKKKKGTGAWNRDNVEFWTIQVSTASLSLKHLGRNALSPCLIAHAKALFDGNITSQSQNEQFWTPSLRVRIWIGAFQPALKLIASN